MLHCCDVEHCSVVGGWRRFLCRLHTIDWSGVEAARAAESWAHTIRMYVLMAGYVLVSVRLVAELFV